jgi:predicted RNA-binding protein YlxR (DUF448 family)
LKQTQKLKEKKIPTRRCTGCGEHFPKNELIRIVRSPEGEISLDKTGKKSGRGAYVCPTLACLKKARKSNRIAQNLECEIPENVYDALEAQLSDN